MVITDSSPIAHALRLVAKRGGGLLDQFISNPKTIIAEFRTSALFRERIKSLPISEPKDEQLSQVLLYRVATIEPRGALDLQQRLNAATANNEQSITAEQAESLWLLLSSAITQLKLAECETRNAMDRIRGDRATATAAKNLGTTLNEDAEVYLTKAAVATWALKSQQDIEAAVAALRQEEHDDVALADAVDARQRSTLANLLRNLSKSREPSED